MDWLLLWIGCAIVGAALMSPHNKAGSGFLLGIFLGPLGVILAAVWRLNANRATVNVPAHTTPEPAATRACPYCAEQIQLAARVCKHCQRDIDPITPIAAKRRCDACGTLVSDIATICPGCHKVLMPPPERNN